MSGRCERALWRLALEALRCAVRGKAWASIEELEAILESEERPEGWQEGEAEG